MTRAHRAQHHHPDLQEPGVLDRDGQPAPGGDPRPPGRARDGATTTRPWARSSSTASRPPRAACPRSRSPSTSMPTASSTCVPRTAPRARRSRSASPPRPCSPRTTWTGWSARPTTHAKEDRQRRDEVETRNQADALAFQAERTLRDLGDKVASADQADVEQKVEAVREALKGNDLSAVRSSADALATVLQKVGTAAYEAAGAASGDGAEPAAEDEPVEGRDGFGVRPALPGPRSPAGRARGQMGRSVPGCGCCIVTRPTMWVRGQALDRRATPPGSPSVESCPMLSVGPMGLAYTLGIPQEAP